jgi:hypothetical protein
MDWNKRSSRREVMLWEIVADSSIIGSAEYNGVLGEWTSIS